MKKMSLFKWVPTRGNLKTDNIINLTSEYLCICILFNLTSKKDSVRNSIKQNPPKKDIFILTSR
jgi:hypothetical protein